MQDFYKILETTTQKKKHKVLMVFDDMIVDMISNKKLSQIVTEKLTRKRKISISTLFITQSYFAVPQYARLNCTHFFIMKFPKK